MSGAKKILIIDDEPEFPDLLGEVLTAQGFQVEVCDNGAEAFSAIKKFSPDLVILDVMLPGLDGYSISKKLLQDENTSKIPIIIMTALEQSKRAFEQLNIRALFLKPFSVSKLIAEIKKTLE